MAFLEVEFPTTISYRAIGGPTFSTIVNEGLSGGESRNRNWSRARGKWTVELRTPAGFADRQAFIDLLVAFFANVGGQADGFRLKDHLSFKAIGEPLVTVTGGVQLARTRSIGGRNYVELVSKPITSSVLDYQGNALPDTVFLHGTATPVTVDYQTGLVSGEIAGTLVDFQYHYPVRFSTDEMKRMVEESDVSGGDPIVTWSSIELIEVLAPNF